MANKNLFLPSGFPRAVLGNGLGRYICQLQRITIKFCKNSGGSRGVREFIEHDLIDFAKNNPNIVLYLKPRRHRSAVFVAEYLNGERKWMSAHNFTRTEVLQWINLLRSQSGIPEVRIRKYWHTENPSIQGPWNPFLFKNPDFNISTLPQEKFSLPSNLAPTASEILVEMFKSQNLSENKEEKNKISNE